MAHSFEGRTFGTGRWAPILHSMTVKRHISPWLLIPLALIMCAEEPPLDQVRAEAIIRSRMFEREPVYAEVPSVIRWGPDYPKDEFDERSLATLENLENAGLIVVEEIAGDGGMTVVTAETTPEGFRELGTVPSARGPALRGRIAQRVLDEIRGFQRHPSQPLVGRAEVVWHYENPTPLYPHFETKQEKPLDVPFVSVVSISKTDRGWIVETVVPKRMMNDEKKMMNDE